MFGVGPVVDSLRTVDNVQLQNHPLGKGSYAAISQLQISIKNPTPRNTYKGKPPKRKKHDDTSGGEVPELSFFVLLFIPLSS